MQYKREKSLFYLIAAIALATAGVSILGYIDYITGEISIDILYLLCICLVTWHTNIWLGLLCVIEVFFAKTAADYYCQIKIGTHLYEWNTFNYIVMYAIVCLLVGKVRKILSE